MANNQYVNKVVFGDQTLIDLSNDTVAANKMLSGITAHSKSGASITGNIPQRDVDTDVTLSMHTVPEVGRQFLTMSGLRGYYSGDFGKGTSTVYLEIPETGECMFEVCVPNGTMNPSQSTSADWIKIQISVDSEGNSNITDGTQGPAEVVYF